MHYIDEGNVKNEVPMIFVHGTPSWSFEFRDIINARSPQQRCIAPDHLGFGLSDKPSDIDYSVQAHARRFSAFIDEMNVGPIDLYLHDFGGPIGLSYALDHPERIRSLYLSNTWLWDTSEDPDVRKIDSIVNSWFGKMLYLWFNASPKYLLKQSFHDKQALTSEIHAHYTNVFPDKASRYGLLGIAQSLMGAADWYDQLNRNLPRLSDIPTTLIWGMEDSFLKAKYLKRWRNLLPDAEVIDVEAGHFVQEEKPEAVISALG